MLRQSGKRTERPTWGRGGTRVVRRLLRAAVLAMGLAALPAASAAAILPAPAGPMSAVAPEHAAAVVVALPPIVSAEAAPQGVLLAGSSSRVQNGWLLVHLQGAPYQIGYQRGYLTAQKADLWLRTVLGPRGSSRQRSRAVAKALVWPKIPLEYQLELKGTAAGLHARGIKADLWDVVAANQWADQSVYAPGAGRSTIGRCSAFIASGAATVDGEIVMGHDTWTSYDRGSVENVLYDVHPAKGHAFRYQGCGGAIWSGEDWYVNDAGLMVCETSLHDAAADPAGVPVFVRARQAVQYAATIDAFVSIMLGRNNGAYPNEWLVGDAKTGEIAALQLGCRAHDLRRTRNGFYGSSNYATGAAFLRESSAPSPATSAPSRARHVRWGQLARKWHGKVDAAVGKAMLADHYDTFLKRAAASSRTICGHFEADAASPYGAIDAKVTTSSLVLGGMAMWARWGHPCGTPFDAAGWLAARSWWAKAHGAFAVAGLKRFSSGTPNRWSLVKGF
jgi:hypothetical protein